MKPCAASRTNAQKLIGQKSTFKAPAPDAKPEEVEKFNSQLRDVLGIPQKADDYKLTKPEKLPEGLTWDEAKAGDFAKLAHSLNIPPAAANKIAEWQMQQMAGMVDAGKQKLDAWVQSQTAELRKDWGADLTRILAKQLRRLKSLASTSTTANSPTTQNSSRRC